MLYTEELPTGDMDVMLSVIRRRGLSGHVIIRWKMSGEHNGDYDILPQQGQVRSKILYFYQILHLKSTAK